MVTGQGSQFLYLYNKVLNNIYTNILAYLDELKVICTN